MKSGRHIGILRRKMNCGYERRIHIRSFCFSDRKRLNNVSIYDFSEITRDFSINTKGKREPRSAACAAKKTLCHFHRKSRGTEANAFCPAVRSNCVSRCLRLFLMHSHRHHHRRRRPFFCNPTFSSKREAPPPFCRSNGRTYSGTPRRCPCCP